MGYHPPKRCKKCKSQCQTIYAKYWILNKAKWTMRIIGYRCIKNAHTIYLPENKHATIRRPKRSIK